MTDARTVHAFADDALADHDAVALAALIRAGTLTTAEVVDAAIARAERVNPAINAIHIDNFDAARTQARRGAISPNSVFAGIPTFVKDNTDLRDQPTQHGSQAVAPVAAKTDSSFARQFLAQGLLPIGKSSLPEFGFNASTEFMGLPPTRNPWHTGYSSGASSGGSAALVAAGVVPIAHANDGGGSIRIPAAACGLVGLKPTRGRLVDIEAARVLPVNIVADGVVTRSVRDTAYFFAGAEQHFRNRKLPAIGLVEGPAKKRLRIGLVFDSITGHATDADTRATVAATAALLEAQGHRVEEMPLPITAQFADDFSTYVGMLSFLVSSFGQKLFSPEFDSKKLDNLSVGLAALYRRNALRTPMVIYRLRRSQQQYAKAMKSYDAVLSPVLAHTTPTLGWLSPEQDFEQLFERLTRYVSFTPLNNATGSPAISVPMGATAEGLPIAVHLSARHGDERTLLELAYELEAIKPFRRIQDFAPA
ncbi:MAG: amidase [Moraxellaceae bacterium]|nr:amidase [Moraxellaceae bacterium]